MKDEKKPLLIIAGPTAAGKSRLSVLLAEKINGEIISADSMQVYRHMDIGSAKITAQEMQGIPHHLIDILEPSEDFNVALFQNLAKQAMAEIYGRGRIPILVGGTGVYSQSRLYDIDFTEAETDYAYRKSLEEFSDTKGAEALFERLKEADPESAAELHPNNVKRVIRALEYYHLTGQKISEHIKEQRKRLRLMMHFILS